jgi:hypothetical protein
MELREKCEAPHCHSESGLVGVATPPPGGSLVLEKLSPRRPQRERFGGGPKEISRTLFGSKPRRIAKLPLQDSQ